MHPWYISSAERDGEADVDLWLEEVYHLHHKYTSVILKPIRLDLSC